MTDKEQTEPAANATPENADAPASEEKDEKADEKEDADEDEAEDEDEKKSKKDKDKSKKAKIDFKGSMSRNEAISYFEAIIGGLRAGRLEFKQGDRTLVLDVPEHLCIEVEAQAKGDKASIEFEIEWSPENTPVAISH